jgi:hypothetical protein
MTESEHGAVMADSLIAFIAKASIYGESACRRAHEILSAAWKTSDVLAEECVLSAACNLLMDRLREYQDAAASPPPAEGGDPADAAGEATAEEITPDYTKQCTVCGASPVVPVTGMCGPCTFGEASTAGGKWFS